MDVTSLEHVVIRAKLGDIIGFQIIQIAEQTASFQLTIIALAIEIVRTYRDLERYTSGLGTCTVGIQYKLQLSVHRVVENPYRISTAYIGNNSQQGDDGAQNYRDNRGGLGVGECIYVGESGVDMYTKKNDITQCITHREVVSAIVIHRKFGT